MAESSGSVLELLRSNSNLSQRNRHIFFSLISRSTKLPMPVIVIADDLAFRDIKERKLEIKDLLNGCSDIFRKNGLDFSYDLQAPLIKVIHERWFSEYLDKGIEGIRSALTFEAQDMFLQLETSAMIFLTGHLRIGNGNALNVCSGLRGRGIMIVGTGSYNFWRNMKKEKVSFVPIFAICSWILSLIVIIVSQLSSPSISTFEILPLIISPFIFWILYLVDSWTTHRVSDPEYANRIFQVMAHEQGHLFGLHHSDEKRSVMFRYSSLTKRFDESSKKKLQKALRRCNEIDASFYKTSIPDLLITKI